MVAKMSRLLETALVHLNEQVDDLKQQLKSETERNRRLEQQVDQLKQSVAKQEERQRGQDFGEDQGISQYARFNGALTTALGLGRPWVYALSSHSAQAHLSLPLEHPSPTTLPTPTLAQPSPRASSPLPGPVTTTSPSTECLTLRSIPSMPLWLRMAIH